MSRDAAVEIRRVLNDPRRVCRLLQLEQGSKSQAGGLMVRCPWHQDSDPSCSITRGPDGTTRARCFSCGATGDALALVAAVYGLDPRREFAEVLLVGAQLAGLTQLVEELSSSGTRAPNRPMPPMPEPEPSRDYPPASEVEAVWAGAVAVDQIEPCQIALALRSLFPGHEQARALTGSALPQWARYRGMSWADTGHRVVVPAFDSSGAMRSLRAWQVNRDYAGPKRLPPAGHKASGLVLANREALAMLRAPSAPVRLVVAEGEPDYLALSQAYPGLAVIGVGNGAWTDEFAARVPFGSLATVRTHHDEAGDRYAQAIIKSLAGRARTKRGAP